MQRVHASDAVPPQPVVDPKTSSRTDSRAVSSAPLRIGSTATSLITTFGATRVIAATSFSTRSARAGPPAWLDLAGQHHQRRVQHDAGGGDAQGQPARPARRAAAPRRAGGDRGAHHVGGLGAAEAVLLADRLGRVRGDQGLERALGAALVDVARDLGAGHRQVTDLAGGAGAAVVQPATDHRGEADAAADPDQHEVVEPLAAPWCCSAMATRFTSLPKTTGVLRSLRSSASRPRCQRGRSKANETSLVCGSTRPGGAEHDPADGRPCRCRPGRPPGRPRCAPRAPGRRCPGSTARCGRRPSPVMSAQAAMTRSGSDLDADDMGATGSDGVQLRVGAAATGLLADPAHQTALLEPLDQLRGGDLAQTGHLTELRPGQRTLREQQLQRGAVVERAQQPRCPRQAGGGHSYVPWYLGLFPVTVTGADQVAAA